MVKRYCWEIPVEEAQAVAQRLIEIAAEPGDPDRIIRVDDIIPQVAPNAVRVEYEVPASEMDTGDGKMWHPNAVEHEP